MKLETMQPSMFMQLSAFPQCIAVRTIGHLDMGAGRWPNITWRGYHASERPLSTKHTVQREYDTHDFMHRAQHVDCVGPAMSSKIYDDQYEKTEEARLKALSAVYEVRQRLLGVIGSKSGLYTFVSGSIAKLRIRERRSEANGDKAER